jgi:hypothetical protein
MLYALIVFLLLIGEPGAATYLAGVRAVLWGLQLVGACIAAGMGDRTEERS